MIPTVAWIAQQRTKEETLRTKPTPLIESLQKRTLKKEDMGQQEAKASEEKNSKTKGQTAQEWDTLQDHRSPGNTKQKEATNGRLNKTTPLRKRKEAKGRKEAKEPARENTKDWKRITLYQAFFHALETSCENCTRKKGGGKEDPMDYRDGIWIKAGADVGPSGKSKKKNMKHYSKCWSNTSKKQQELIQKRPQKKTRKRSGTFRGGGSLHTQRRLKGNQEVQHRFSEKSAEQAGTETKGLQRCMYYAFVTTPNDAERLTKKQSGPESRSTNFAASTSKETTVPKTSMKERLTNTSSISFQRSKESMEITKEWAKKNKKKDKEPRETSYEREWSEA